MPDERPSPAGPAAPREQRTIPDAPEYDSLAPITRKRSARNGEDLHEISVNLRVVTPIYGGAAQTRKVDQIDFIRVPSIRGQLRFWWRALQPEVTAAELFRKEAKLWGMAGKEDTLRSTVELRIAKQGSIPGTDDTNPMNNGLTAYALWPARVAGENAERRMPGVRFTLTLLAPKGMHPELRNALRAWILFGGYGGRTRRGVGSLAIDGNAAEWLPQTASRDALKQLFEGVEDIFFGGAESDDMPRLAGASLYAGMADVEAERAWATALGWLREFRQMPPARPRPGGAPTFTNWPEPDMMRLLFARPGGPTWAHTPRYHAGPAWPRAGFGLPIVGRFRRDNLPPGRAEPPNFTLLWHDGRESRNRLASPLIVKALPLANGEFAPCALWLNRAYPRGEVFLDNPRHTPGGTGAPFDQRYVHPEGFGIPGFIAAAGESSLKDSFLNWLGAKGLTRIA